MKLRMLVVLLFLYIFLLIGLLAWIVYIIDN